MSAAKNSSISNIITCLFAVCLISLPSQAKYGGGTGEPNDPYQIATAVHLNLLGTEPNDWDKHFELTADIDMSDFSYTRAVIAWDADDSDFWFFGNKLFAGTFDGGGHQITNLTIDTGSAEKGHDFLGLFGFIGGEAVIKNLRIVNISITGGTNSDYIGALAGEAEYALIEDCSVTGSITSRFNSDYLGGLVGICQHCTMKNNDTTCNITTDDGSNYIGGMAGWLNGVSITDCRSSGSIQASTQSSSVGGLIGKAAYATVVTRCSSSSSVSADTGSWEVGGLLGSGYDTLLEGCSSSGTVRGGLITFSLGGLAGCLELCVLENCCSEAAVEGDTESYDIGGLVGCSIYTSVTGCCSRGPVSGGVNTDYMGGLIGDFVVSPYLNFQGSHAIIDCNSSGTVTGQENSDHVGGLVGRLRDSGIIYNCHASGDVLGEEEVGGLVGWNDGDIGNSFATGDVATVYDADRVGGLVGRNEGLIVTSYAGGSVTGGYNSDDLGGLVGRNAGNIVDCYATGLVSGGQNAENLGGLVGYNSSSGSHITHCYSMGKIIGISGSEQLFGGLVGYQSNGYVTGCIWDIETSEMSTGAGMIGSKSDEYIINGLTTEQMSDATLFRNFGWNFVGDTTISEEQNWMMVEGIGRPVLAWQYESGIELPEFSGGSGTQTDPYLIANPDNLSDVTSNPRLLDKHFKLIADIDMGSADSMPLIGTRQCPFTGVFDGDGHGIYNPTVINVTDFDDYMGLFGCLDYGAQVRNLVLSVRMIEQEAITVGGLVGYLNQATVENCHISGEVTGRSYVGGLVGYNYRGVIMNCSTDVEVTGYNAIGGLAGFNGGTLNCCFSVGRIDGTYHVGGFTGYNTGMITNCYSSGSVIAEFQVGGFLGYNSGTLIRCYSTGMVDGYDHDLAGGLLGQRGGNSYISGCFWDTQTSGRTTSAGGYDKTTAEMQTADTFLEVGWDFVDETDNGSEDIWWIEEGSDYPRLEWELSAEFSD
jgi:hypothetical protein